MKKRITLVTLFNSKEINKVKNIMNKLDQKTCKVPYGIDDKNRYEIDTLPFHFTVFATDKENEKTMIELMQGINMQKIKLEIEKAEIMKLRNNSFCLYLAIKENTYMKDLQRIFYNKLPGDKYNPDNFVFHLTLHIDKDYEKVLSMQKIINDDFKSFSLEFDKLGLFDYPGDIIKEIKLSK